MKVKLDDGAFMPERAHFTDAGLDLFSPADYTIYGYGGKSVVIDTGVHVQLPHGTVGMLKSKSGLNVKHGLVSEGVIDEGYTGAIKVKLYNQSGEDYHVRRGDKISQLVVMPVEYVDLELVDELDASDRGDGGFGSTGR